MGSLDTGVSRPRGIGKGVGKGLGSGGSEALVGFGVVGKGVGVGFWVVGKGMGVRVDAGRGVSRPRRSQAFSSCLVAGLVVAVVAAGVGPLIVVGGAYRDIVVTVGVL